MINCFCINVSIEDNGDAVLSPLRKLIFELPGRPVQRLRGRPAIHEMILLEAEI